MNMYNYLLVDDGTTKAQLCAITSHIFKTIYTI